MTITTAPAFAERIAVRFPSGDSTCAAWHYPGENGGCVVMGAGTGVVKEPGTDAFAARFHEAGFSVLALDFRHLGESGGTPRQIIRIGEQLEDYSAAIGFARTLPEVDPRRIAIWGFSLAGGHVLRVAARQPALAAAIAQTPLTDAPAIAPNAFKHMTPGAGLRLQTRALMDAIARRAGRPPRLIPLAGPRGTVAALTTPDAAIGQTALNPGNRYPNWEQTVAAGSALRLAFYRPGRFARQIACPLLVVICDDDQSVLVKPSAKAARRAPRGEVVRLPGNHYAPFLERHEQAVEAEVAFLKAHLTVDAPAAPSAR